MSNRTQESPRPLSARQALLDELRNPQKGPQAGLERARFIQCLFSHFGGADGLARELKLCYDALGATNPTGRLRLLTAMFRLIEEYRDPIEDLLEEPDLVEAQARKLLSEMSHEDRNET